MDKQVCAQLCLERLIIDVMWPQCNVPKPNVLAIRAIKHQDLKVAFTHVDEIKKEKTLISTMLFRKTSDNTTEVS